MRAFGPDAVINRDEISHWSEGLTRSLSIRYRAETEKAARAGSVSMTVREDIFPAAYNAQSKLQVKIDAGELLLGRLRKPV